MPDPEHLLWMNPKVAKNVLIADKHLNLIPLKKIDSKC